MSRTEGEPIPAPDNTLAVALSLAKHGWPVFPVRLVPVTRADGSVGELSDSQVRMIDQLRGLGYRVEVVTDDLDRAIEIVGGWDNGRE